MKYNIFNYAIPTSAQETRRKYISEFKIENIIKPKASVNVKFRGIS